MPPVGQLAPARLLLDGDAGIVRDLLPQAGQGVEDRRLAAVGISRQGNRQRARRRKRRIIGDVVTTDGHGWSDTSERKTIKRNPMGFTFSRS